jgi:hypothetical protein
MGTAPKGAYLTPSGRIHNGRLLAKGFGPCAIMDTWSLVWRKNTKPQSPQLGKTW